MAKKKQVGAKPAETVPSEKAKELWKIGISEKFALLNKLITRDLNNTRSAKSFTKYKKDDIAKYLENPSQYEKQLRDAILYIYGASPHFRRLIQYFVGLSDLSYIIEPYKIDPKKTKEKTLNNSYRKTLNFMSSMDAKNQLPKILTVCLREDVFYGTLWVTNDNVTIQQLPSDYCAISSIEGNVFNVSFDFSYFDSNKDALNFYPKEFEKKYNEYKSGAKGKNKQKWIELDAPTSFAVKCNTDISNYPLPPFAGILREIYDIEDYKDLMLTKTSLENYAMLAMTIPMKDDGTWGIDFDRAEEFWRNLDSVLPDEIGSVLTPMPINKISFERAHGGEEDTIANAEQNLFTAAGVSSLLFNNEKASANALLLSIKTDQSMTYNIVKSIEGVINRYLQSQAYGKNFKVNFLDVSPYNRKEMGDAYLKAASYGLPTISMYAASQGLGQAELDSMSYLETSVLKLQDMFIPIQSSTQMSSADLEGKGATDEGGAPVKDVGERTDSGEQSAEQKDDWG